MGHFKFNSRGGLSVDRDSLHASPEFKRQIEALSKLSGTPMTLPQNVADALGELEAAHDQRFAPWRNQWQTIRAHLMIQEAEIARVKSIADAHCDGRLTAIASLAAANAQLRLMHRVLSQAVCVACADDGSAKDHELDKLEGVLRDQGWITTAVVPSTPTDAHLQGAGDEADRRTPEGE